MTIHILALSGSLRAASTNTAVLRTAIELAPDDVEMSIHDLRDLPFYDGDLEEAGAPESVEALRTALERADALLIATPEYNWSVPAVLKNAIDWASRGPDSPLEQLPTAVISAAGGSGGRRVQAHLREVFAHNDVDLLDEQVMIPRARVHIEDGRLVGEPHRTEVRSLVAALAEHAESMASRSAA
ncbi:NADPH-dependent FMN reductase [Euzebya rosea]|uniref:NADPH-dependent FMN reductase n=1 Tax=Euzebya rosea TaxID=2052804 RepID=UPI000D3E7D35|nr:NAD(P)H-dependent oxidoreductase [Euzebya rosea]